MGFFKRDKSYPDPIRNIGCKEFEVDNWILSDFILEKIIPGVGCRPFPLNELMLMCAAVCRHRPTLIFDWGTHVGKSAWIFSQTIRTFNIPCHIHSVDLPDDVEHVEHPSDQRGRMVKARAEVSLHQGDGVSRSLELFDAHYQHGNVLFYVDGDHSYESVKRELKAILDYVPNAIVLLHDTFLQSEGSGYNVGPHQAIKEVMSLKDGYTSMSTTTGLPGMTLIFPRP